MAAVVFTAHPNYVNALKRLVEQKELEVKREEMEHRANLVRYVNSLKKDELRKALLVRSSRLKRSGAAGNGNRYVRKS